MAHRIAIYYDQQQLQQNSFFLSSLVAAGRSLGAEVISLLGSEALQSCQLGQVDAVLVRSRSLRQRLWLAQRIPRVINSPLLALVGNDKLAQYLWCKRNGFATPRTLTTHVVPTPWVSKPRFGHGGRGVRLIEARCWRSETDAMLAQEYHPEGVRDHRHYVLGSTVVTTVERRAKDDFRSNLSQGASVQFATPSEQERSLVEAVVARLGPGYYGVDIVTGPVGPMVMEIEDLVGARSLYQLGLDDHATRVMKWVCGL
ncbi:ATP-grasp domain-containing protein [Ferrimicrobium sp.]|uniref:ATP-grasp domain-containing protein n=1 Tax=Ferrimicrobium sp. TaxID=2926050 RepID=UPI002609E5B1|nr:ATP-grasp domain-containing protein [Ferrimicrobium sp.]